MMEVTRVPSDKFRRDAFVLVEPGQVGSTSMQDCLDKESKRDCSARINFSYPRVELEDGFRSISPTISLSNHSCGSLKQIMDRSHWDGAEDDCDKFTASVNLVWSTLGSIETNHKYRRQRLTTGTNSRQPRKPNSALRKDAPEHMANTEVNAATLDGLELDYSETDLPVPASSNIIPPQMDLDTKALCASAYSIYPKPAPLPPWITIPPRGSSLPLGHPNRPLKGSKSLTDMKPLRSPPFEKPRPAPLPQTRPRPRPRSLAPLERLGDKVHYDDSAPPEIPPEALDNSKLAPPPQLDHFASVFESDSDTDYGKGHKVTRRLPTRLNKKKSHNKSWSEKSLLEPKEIEIVADVGEAVQLDKGGVSLPRMWAKNKKRIATAIMLIFRQFHS